MHRRDQRYEANGIFLLIVQRHFEGLAGLLYLLNDSGGCEEEGQIIGLTLRSGFNSGFSDPES